MCFWGNEQAKAINDNPWLIDYLDWTIVSQYQILSEQFIFQCRKYLHWPSIFYYQSIGSEYKKIFENEYHKYFSKKIKPYLIKV